MPEGRGIFGNLSVVENLVMAARAGTRGQRDWTYERVLETFPRLKERLGHGGQQLSGGEQQMLTIGRALMTNPDVLILDEATEGLAPLIAREIWRICGLIRESGISSVIVDKNWKHVTQITDRNVILVKGEVVFAGTLGRTARAAATAGAVPGRLTPIHSPPSSWLEVGVTPIHCRTFIRMTPIHCLWMSRASRHGPSPIRGS